jgi:hypothetical protein
MSQNSVMKSSSSSSLAALRERHGNIGSKKNPESYDQAFSILSSALDYLHRKGLFV